MAKENSFFIEGLEDKAEKLNELSKKLKEARTIANELASTQIIINDKRQKDITEYINELRKGFMKNFGHEPQEFLLTAKQGFREFHIRLNL
ncbi:hypothetical protein [Halomonas sp. PAR8]|uniref:hypothetical protein n=1 Tax=Halomonas sp. PAR8 TaxID=3075515 RepID=UPI002885D405|nr:hypothetical protein [Halomonas sp. PAR8]MDT0593207.1 hypothetical protein [Halomonas sp. PAR8]